jgi:hypothetical protein
MKKLFLSVLLTVLWAPGLLEATVLYEAFNVEWSGGGSALPITLSQPMTKTDTYYIQYTVSLTSTVPPVIPNVDPNNRNSAYPYVNLNNNTNGGAAFLFYLGGGYNNDFLFSTGFTTSTWNTNEFSATDATGPNSANRVSTGLVAQYSTPEYGTVKYEVTMIVNMGAGTYDYLLTKLDGSGNVLDQSALMGLDLVKGNYWNNNQTFSNLMFQSSTSQMTAHFDHIIVSEGPFPVPIPEPGTVVLAGLGAALLGLSRRRRRA